MLKLTVSQDGCGGCQHLRRPCWRLPYELEAEMRIGPGIYRESWSVKTGAHHLRGAGG